MSDPRGEQAPASEVGDAVEDPRGDLRWGSIPGLVSDAAARFGDAEAVADGDVRLCFAQLEGEALRVTGAAMAAGIHPGDRVAMWAPNMAEWIVAALGLVGAGAALVPLNTRFKGPEAAYVLTRSRARALFTVRGFLGIDYPAMLDDEDVPDLERIVLLRDDEGTTSEVTKTDEVPIFGWHEFLAGAEGVVECDEGVVGAPVDERTVRERWDSVTGDDLSDVIFTSGTTGRPKGAMTTHAQTLRTFATWASIVGLAEGDRYLVVNPFFHTFGYKAGIIACLMQGATIVPEPVFDVDKVLATVAARAHHRAPGPAHALPVDPRPSPARRSRPLEPAPGRDRRGGGPGGAREAHAQRAHLLHRPHRLRAHRVHRHGHHVPPGGRPRDHRRDLGACHPRPRGARGRRRGRRTGAGEPGEIVVRGYTVVAGYFEDPEATAEAIDAQGWLHTGDVGVMDDAGNVRITDRKKDMFIVGGFNAYPAEIEGTLLRHPGVAQAAVIGVPDERMGEVGCAFVVPRPGTATDALAEKLLAWSRDQMANYKVPRHVEVTDALPTNASGKVLKTELRERFAQRPAKGA